SCAGRRIWSAPRIPASARSPHCIGRCLAGACPSAAPAKSRFRFAWILLTLLRATTVPTRRFPCNMLQSKSYERTVSDRKISIDLRWVVLEYSQRATDYTDFTDEKQVKIRVIREIRGRF